MTVTLEEELLTHLDSAIPEGETKTRNIDVVAFFNGFGSSTWPTLEETGQHFGGITRERTRQIIAANYRDRVGAEDLPELRACAERISAFGIWFASDLAKLLVDEGWADEDANILGVLNMMQGLGLCTEYGLYDGRITSLTRSKLDEVEDYLILDGESVKLLKAAVKETRRIPGLVGLADVAHLSQIDVELKTLLAVIRLHPEAWVGESGGITRYCFEDRENVLVNMSEKVFSVFDKVEISRLAATLANALRRRSTNLSYPDQAAIEQYIRGSKFFQCGKRMAKFEGETTELTDIETDIVDFLDENGPSDFVTVRAHLVSLGYGIPLFTKTIGANALVNVDRSAGRKQFVYSLVGRPRPLERQPVDDALTDDDRYSRFAARLQRIGAIGSTDADVQSTHRREQSILSKYLFEGRKTHLCAICGEEHDVASLVTAHKKKRSLCNERERLDPHIVMPLCVFGCDHLYERGLLQIFGGRVTGDASKATGAATKAFIDRIAGKCVSKEWLQGGDSYFQR